MHGPLEWMIPTHRQLLHGDHSSHEAEADALGLRHRLWWQQWRIDLLAGSCTETTHSSTQYWAWVHPPESSTIVLCMHLVNSFI